MKGVWNYSALSRREDETRTQRSRMTDRVPCSKCFQVYYPELFVWVSQEPFPNKDMEGRLPKGRLPVPKEVNRKKNDETNAASLTPLGSSELRSPRISYLHFF
ncbi:neuronal regeneration-related protein isoform b [Homo sapiens]|uniref:neuronal regeneration-related protein isoform b n=1 Tax=Homo sapiens TaxID=9606 RepID=UPI000187F6BA|nr:neuronal regeneration-related protein isoform b [Homo sapiens]|eukprot:NP_001135946.1 neuronal regeneration-related protein isoform b [Homo sapiens]